MEWHPGDPARVQTRPQLVERHTRSHRRAVLHHVQVVAVEVDDAFPARVCHVRVPDVPLLRDRPVEHRVPDGTSRICTERDLE